MLNALLVQIRSMPVRKDDEVVVVRGKFTGREGKVLTVYRKKFAIQIERVQKEKANGTCSSHLFDFERCSLFVYCAGQSVFVNFHPSKVNITKLKTTYKDRKEAIDRKKAGRDARMARGASSMDQVDA